MRKEKDQNQAAILAEIEKQNALIQDVMDGKEKNARFAVDCSALLHPTREDVLRCVVMWGAQRFDSACAPSLAD